ncbi:transposase [Streptomyces sp. NBC_01707]
MKRQALGVLDRPKLGKILQYKNGRTLYLFTKDEPWPMKTACDDACLQNWTPTPPVTAADAKAVGNDPRHCSPSPRRTATSRSRSTAGPPTPRSGVDDDLHIRREPSVAAGGVDLPVTEKLVIATARPAPGNRADARVWRESGLAEHCRDVTVLGDGAYINTGLVVLHRKRPGRPLLAGEEAGNAEHRKVRARVEHAFARLKNYKLLRDCRQRGDSFHHAVQAVARMHNLALES